MKRKINQASGGDEDSSPAKRRKNMTRRSAKTSDLIEAGGAAQEDTPAVADEPMAVTVEQQSTRKIQSAKQRDVPAKCQIIIYAERLVKNPRQLKQSRRQDAFGVKLPDIIVNDAYVFEIPVEILSPDALEDDNQQRGEDAGEQGIEDHAAASEAESELSAVTDSPSGSDEQQAPDTVKEGSRNKQEATVQSKPQARTRRRSAVPSLVKYSQKIQKNPRQSKSAHRADAFGDKLPKVLDDSHDFELAEDVRQSKRKTLQPSASDIESEEE